MIGFIIVVALVLCVSTAFGYVSWRVGGLTVTKAPGSPERHPYRAAATGAEPAECCAAWRRTAEKYEHALEAIATLHCDASARRIACQALGKKIDG